MAEPDYAGDISSALDSDVSKLLLLGRNTELKRLEEDFAKLNRSDCGVVFSSKNLIEFMPPGVSKGNALIEAAGRLGVPMEEVIAIGDQDNDVSMIKAAGLGAAVANAVPGARSAADYVARRDCVSGGVAEIINKFALGGGV
jgi:hydroxymethylpyrimidine pyrophosphatase-like HAD family hydrolase